ncbi:MAG: DUF4922 domain-containing protein [Bacteroidales bacterium]|nr:DUF4922 domain-containing protein [Bacteroidales bacterium]
MNDIHKFIRDQLSVWPLAAGNFRAVKGAQYRSFELGGLTVQVQLNPCRIASSTAKTDPASIAARPCFLCAHNRPKEQFHLKFEGKKGRSYNIQVNPYPVTREHLVVVRDTHLPQTIWHHFPDMLLFTRLYPDFTAFYNGPYSGASAPDHLHFQACPRGILPLEAAADAFLDHPDAALASVQDASLYRFPSFTRGVYVLKSTTQKSMAKLFYRLLECSPRREGEGEPRFNLYNYFKDGEYRTIVVLRSTRRSHHYDAEGAEHLAMSPGAADMGGLFIAPRREDFEKLTREMLSAMVEEVSISAEEDARVVWRLTREQRFIDVGILSAREIVFEIISDGAGPQRVSWCDGRINYNGSLYDELTFDAITRSTLFAEPSFVLHDVVIGIGFHWERKVTRQYAGRLRFIVEDDRITAINRVGVEDYLLSVISSEMCASAPLEFLKAHAIISRSWLMNNLHTHPGYDVCADDHCQRYQGLNTAVGSAVRDAIDQTWGQTLNYGGAVCDTRYSKCCGGRTELFSTCWEDRDEPYLPSVPDTPGEEEGADPFCAGASPELLARVLNDYDRATDDFYRWEVRYDREELSELVRRRSGIDFGTIRSLEAVERGPSGRIKRLRIEGTKHTEVIGKELVIRRTLSESHLKSSAFEMEWAGDTLILRGRGWGHGVGLCQIGAAVMADRGYDCAQILAHYYPGAEIAEL